MAEDYTPNLDDGEWLLPSGIFPDEGAYRSHCRRPSSEMLCGLDYPSSDHACIQGRTRKFSASVLFDRKQAPFVPKKPPPNLSHPSEGFRPELWHGSMAVDAGPSYRYRGSIALHGERVSGTSSMFPHPLNLGNPVRIQMERHTRARVLQRQQNQDQARSFPGHASGSGREYGGTGVFLPRINGPYSRKKATVKNGGENSNQPTRNGGPVGQQGMTLQPPSEMDLPQDWTY